MYSQQMTDKVELDEVAVNPADKARLVAQQHGQAADFAVDDTSSQVAAMVDLKVIESFIERLEQGGARLQTDKNKSLKRLELESQYLEDAEQVRRSGSCMASLGC